MISAASKSITLNTTYQLLAKVITMTVTVGVTILITRIYGRLGYGEFNLMQNFPAFFFIIADFGLNAIVVREISKDWSKAEEMVGNVLFLRSVLSALLILVSAILLTFLPYSPFLKLGIFLSLFMIWTQSLYATTNIIFQPKLRYDLSSIGLIVGSVTVLILALTLSFLKVPVIWVSFSYVLGGIATFLVNASLVKKLGVNIKPVFNSQLTKYLLIQALPLGLMFIFSQVNFKADAIFMSFLPLPDWLGLSNTEAVGVYGLPYKVFEVSLVFPTFFMNAAYPVIIRHMIEGKERLKGTFFKVMSVLFVAAFVVAVASYFLAPFVISILGGEGFERSVFVLRVLLGGSLFFYLTQPISWLIVTLEGQRHLPWVYLASAVFNVTANLILIPRYAFYASSFITLASELIILVLLILVAFRVWKRRYA